MPLVFHNESEWHVFDSQFHISAAISCQNSFTVGSSSKRRATKLCQISYHVTCRYINLQMQDLHVQTVLFPLSLTISSVQFSLVFKCRIDKTQSYI